MLQAIEIHHWRGDPARVISYVLEDANGRRTLRYSFDPSFTNPFDQGTWTLAAEQPGWQRWVREEEHDATE